MNIRQHLLLPLFLLIIATGCTSKKTSKIPGRAEQTLDVILDLYDAGHNNLFNETYPYKEENRATYLAGEDTLQGKRVAYLWPASGVFSGVNALLRSTGDQKYLTLIEEVILPGLDNYFDHKREPVCYQSYIMQRGESDRFYDDNVWLAIDFCDLYNMTGKKEYLQKSEQLWEFVISGWDENLNGGIYWCEQKKHSKNTCSNAPASVLALKLYEATNESKYFVWGQEIYRWTKDNLQDTADFLYFDNKNLEGKVDTRKYTYNSGQMLQASALLYQLTGEKKYLLEAQNIAASAIAHFTEEFTTPEGETIRLFKNTGNWFNAVLFRGYVELYRIDKNPAYIGVYRDNMDHLWENVRNREGFFSKDWTGQKEDEHKWLLDQAGLVEIWALLDALKNG